MEITEALYGYPVFRSEQVLTESQLNQVVEYLSSQEQLTRTALIGTGIVCGLHPTLDDDVSQLTLSPGCGVTSRGNIIHLQETILTHYRAYQTDELPGVDRNTPGIFELFTAAEAVLENETADERAIPFSEAPEGGIALASILSDMVVVQVLSEETILPKKCATTCDDLGTNLLFVPRTLVLDAATATRIVRAGYGIPQGTSLDAFFNGSLHLADLHVRRFGHRGAKSNQVDLTRIDNHQAFLEVLLEACASEEDGIAVKSGAIEAKISFERFGKAYRDAARLWNVLCADCRPDSAKDFEHLEDRLSEILEKLLSDQFRNHAQYFHSFLKDLATAYAELKDATWDLAADCLPSPDRHPQHLMLGPCNAPEEWPASVFRTRFIQPPIYNGMAERKASARILYQRMQLLASQFELPEAGEIRITPSRQAPEPLGRRAVPFYYVPQVVQRWDPELTRRTRTGIIPSYHLPQASPDHPSPILLRHDLEGHDFYRVEGHTGVHPLEAVKQILELRSRFNLAFDVVMVKAGATADSEDIHLDFEIMDLEMLYATMRDALLCLLQMNRFQKAPAKQRKMLLEGLQAGEGSAAGAFSTLERLQSDDVFTAFATAHQTVFEWAANELQVFDCTPGQVEPLRTAYKKRVTDLKDLLTLKRFAEHHPGLERMDGVPRGGTFVLVYADPDEVGKPLPGRDALDSAIGGIREAVLEDQPSAGRPRAELAGAAARATERSLASAERATVGRTVAAERAGTSRAAIETTAERVGVSRATAAAAAKEERAEIAAFEALKRRLKRAGEHELIERLDRLVVEVKGRTDVVIGDFCLPYRCCSKTPAVSFVMARPRPVAFLDRSSFCEDDAKTYPFTLHPPGGVLRGPGVQNEAGRYVFAPASAEVKALPPDATGARQVTFNYFADGAEDDFVVAVLPVPDARFVIDRIGDQQSLCIHPAEPPEPFQLTPRVPGGIFKASADVLIQNGDLWFFDAAKATPGEPVTISYHLSTGGCPAEQSQTVTIFTTPDPTFNIKPELGDRPCIEVSVEGLLLVPVQVGGVFTVILNDKPADDFLKITDDGAFFDIRGALAQRKVTVGEFVVHYAIGKEPCDAESERKGRIGIAPDPAFKMEPEGPYSMRGEPVKLIPSQTGDAINSSFEGEGVQRNVFFPGEVQMGNESKREIEIKHRILDDRAGCMATATIKVTVFRPE